MKRFYGILSALAFIGVVGRDWPAYAGPCTAQIAQVEQQISHTSVDSEIGPSAPQSVGAQLGRQPTPQTARDAEMQASAIAQRAPTHQKSKCSR